MKKLKGILSTICALLLFSASVQAGFIDVYHYFDSSGNLVGEVTYGTGCNASATNPNGTTINSSWGITTSNYTVSYGGC
ncbi:hypothetical protein [Agaribacter marinus]|uniref:Uncharacterized protein n=1 Tax=Agaribacter marinus TaxID=1431249 RepID=A0AA37SZ91_9ALTE|nr:hypothetical protein [Agaribacter marinus]GLR72418.1 hypothetical protein GCM10007852_33260 [Agaribacter marinus]